MGRVKTFTNGGSLLPGDLNSIEDDYEFAFSTYKELADSGGGILTGVASGSTQILLPSGVQPVGGASTARGVVYLDLADYLANTRATKYRLRAALMTNAVAPASTFTFGIYQVATWGGAAGADPTVATVGAVVPGSTVAFAAPGAGGASQGSSGDFAAPAAGYYVVGVAVTVANMAANSVVTLRGRVNLRQV